MGPTEPLGRRTIIPAPVAPAAPPMRRVFWPSKTIRIFPPSGEATPSGIFPGAWGLTPEGGFPINGTRTPGAAKVPGVFPAPARAERKTSVRVVKVVLDHPLWLLLLRIGVAGSLLLAAVQKIQSPKAFALSIDAFGMVPSALIIPLAFLFIWQEIIAGVALMLGIWTRASALLAGLLLLVFLGALAWAMLHGMSISCGCFGGWSQGPIGWSSVLRNVALIAAAGWLVYRGGGTLALERWWGHSAQRS